MNMFSLNFLYLRRRAHIIIPAFFFDFVPQSVPCSSVRVCVRASVMLLVNVSPSKPLSVATSIFAPE